MLPLNMDYVRRISTMDMVLGFGYHMYIVSVLFVSPASLLPIDSDAYSPL